MSSSWDGRPLSLSLFSCLTGNTGSLLGTMLEVAYVIGGAQIYEAFMPFVDTLYVTEIDEDFEGDAFFPLIDSKQFNRLHVEEGVMDDKHPYPFRFVTYKRKA